MEVRFNDVSARSLVPAASAHNHLTIGTAIQQGAEVRMLHVFVLLIWLHAEALLSRYCSIQVHEQRMRSLHLTGCCSVAVPAQDHSYARRCGTFAQSVLSLQKVLAAATCRSPRSREYSLLRGISGTFRAGRTTLVLGPSGGGKSLLLQACCGVCPVDITGEITLNGQPLSKCCAHRTTRYVDEEDTFNSQLTVRETLLFASMVQGPRFSQGVGPPTVHCVHIYIF